MNDPTNLNGTAKAIIVCSIIFFCYYMIMWITVTGSKADTWWFFVTPLSLLAGIGFGSALDIIKLKIGGKE